MGHVSLERMSDRFVKLHLGDGTVFHHFSGADGYGADFHDHGQFGFETTILSGGYVEEIMEIDWKARTYTLRHVERRPGDTFRVEHHHVHKIVSLLEPQCYTHVVPDKHRHMRENWYRPSGEGLWLRNGDGPWTTMSTGWTRIDT